MFDPKLLIQGQGTLNYHYLDKLEFVLKNALSEYPRTLAIRIDLHLSPSWFNNDMPFCAPNLSSDLMARFTRSLMAQIDSYRQQLTKHGKRAHPCKLRYYWVRERETSCSSHYHALLFVNKDLFWLLGSFNSENHTLSFMIQKAWLSALRLKGNDEYRALVHFPDNATYVLDRNQPDFTDHYNAFVYRASYLAKERSKAYSVSDRSIGYSQK